MSDTDQVSAADAATEAEQNDGLPIEIRRAGAGDLAGVVAIDAEVTGNAKLEYWQDIFERYGSRRLNERFFLVALGDGGERDGDILGYMVGEIRTWEFGSEPCGWIFGFAVDPSARLARIGEKLFQAITDEFRNAGVRTMRTMVLRQEQLPMGFFRSEGMVAGPYIQLEKELDD